jgi:DNA topoisomerase-2
MSDLKSTATSFSSKSVNEKYQKKTHIQQIKDLPDTYIGSVELDTQTLWVINETTMTMEQAEVSFIPGLFKLFDEVLVNASDHKVRCPELKNIKVNLNKETGSISVWNDGSGIDVEIHDETKVYAPELIFGHLLTSGNYDKTEKKVTGGKNGFGAKLANIFSTKFIVETVDGEREKKYVQEFTDNMSVIGKPKIISCKNKPYVCIEFTPDYKFFKLPGLTDDHIKIFTKRVYDLAATCKDVNIYLNDKKLPIRNFEKYIELYIGSNKKELPRVYQEVSDRWEVGACTSPDGTFNQISFVNGISTYKGGKHVDYVADSIVRRLTKYINEKKTKLNVKESYVKSNIWIFIRCLVENPAFSSQTKEELTTVSKNFGSKCEVSDDFIEKLAKSGVMDKAVELTTFKEKDSLKKTDGAKRTTLIVPKLEDANKAGGAESYKCTLILTEGDSAKAGAISGLSALPGGGRDYYGVFPLKGKLLNVREANNSQLLNNEEIKNIKKIVGLQHYAKEGGGAKVYKDVKELRYGKILIMTDADVDGSHIKGLLMNFFHFHWPSLLRIPNFIDTLKTPIVKVTKGKAIHSFHTLSEYEKWKMATPAFHTWKTKYYKGLGTSTSVEFKEYFKDLQKNLVHYCWKDDSTDNEAITLAFQKDRANDRKGWLNDYNADPNHEKREVVVNDPSYSEFIHNELVHFSNYDNKRSIPSMLDGLKPSQRKILFSCFKKRLTEEMKVAQLSGYVSEQTSYHHGEVSLQGAIIGMAQDFVGSNNINLLMPNGQFGTRSQGGDDSASPRYIFTCLNDVSFELFPEDDFPILKYLDDEGFKIEPDHYYPIVPMILVNGSDGIGTGFRSKVPCYNPEDIYRAFKGRLEIQESGEMFKPFEPIHPWYRKFDGKIEQVDVIDKTLYEEDDAASIGGDADVYRKYVSTGIYTINGDTIKITELPVGTWNQNYKDFIEACIEEYLDNKKDAKAADLKSVDGKKTKSKKSNCIPIISYENHCTEEKVTFTLKIEKGFLASQTHENILKRFKLTKGISTSSMYLYNEDGAIQRYKSPEDIMEEFFTVRLGKYQTRKEYMLNKMKTSCIILENKVKFVQCVLDEKIKWNQEESAIESILEKLGINRLDENAINLGIDYITREVLPGAKVSYNYLLEMPIRSLTKQKIDALKKKYDELTEEYDVLDKTSITGLWLADFKKFEKLFVFPKNTVVKQEIKTASGSFKPKEIGEDKPPVKKLIKKKPVDMTSFLVKNESDTNSGSDTTVGTKPKKILIKKTSISSLVTNESETNSGSETTLEVKPKKVLIKKKSVGMDAFVSTV